MTHWTAPPDYSPDKWEGDDPDQHAWDWLRNFLRFWRK